MRFARSQSLWGLQTMLGGKYYARVEGYGSTRGHRLTFRMKIYKENGSRPNAVALVQCTLDDCKFET
jgi:hypothetical protein